MKRCPGCTVAKPLADFHRSTRSADGLQRLCKDCGNDARRQRVALRRQETLAALPPDDCKRCPRCGEVKARSEYHRNRRTRDGLQTYCRPCSNDIRRDYEQRHASDIAARRNERLARAQVDGEKTCTKCHVTKPRVEFYRHRTTRDGRATYCIQCVKDDRRAWVAANAERVREQNQRYAAENPQKRSRDHRQFWLRAYGLDQNAYQALLDAQGNVCAICLMPERYIDARTGEPRRLSVDHDHQSGRVRGLLCGRCNRALGQLDDDPDRFARAAIYLQQQD